MCDYPAGRKAASQGMVSVFKLQSTWTTIENKNPWNGYGKPFFHILYFSNIQMLHNMHFSNHVDTANGPPPPNNVGMKKLV